MSQLENVTLVKAANIYFDGKVTSRTVIQADGSKISLGIMMPGEYEFGTAEKEIMEILSGQMDVLLADETEWKTYGGGEAFEVPADSKFQLKVISLTDYLCRYIA